MPYQQDQNNAVETALSRDRRHSLSSSRFEALRAFLLDDSYAFTKVVCKHDDLIDEYHAPVSYAFTHSTDQLLRVLADPAYDSYVTQYIRSEIEQKAKSLEWGAVDSLLDVCDFRLYRGWFKSSVCSHGGVVYIATKDPNRTIWLVSSSDPNAWAFSGQVGETIQSGIYRDLFPDRIPEGNINEMVTTSRIRLGGRTISHPQGNIEADGYLTKRTSAHFDTFIIDDLVVQENSNEAFIPGVKQWLANLPGFEMQTRRIWRRHVGTIWAENADYEFMVKGRLGPRTLSVFVPIETYEKEYPENILERGTPTCPKLADVDAIQRKQDSIINDEKQGPIAWRRNYWLNARDGADSLFPPHLIDDVTRRYSLIPNPKDDKHPLFVRLVRDAQGRILYKCHSACEVGKRDGTTHTPECVRRKLVFDALRDLDRVMLIDPSWEDGGDNWAVTLEGWDYELNRFQIRTKSDDNGQEGWLDAAEELFDLWRPRVVGFDGGAYQSASVENLKRYDRRLRRMRDRMVKVPHRNQSKLYRIKQNVAEPYKMGRILLDPSERGIPTRDEMRAYKGDQKFSPGILDTLAMAPAVALRKRKPEDAERMAEEIARKNRAYQQSIDPILGVPRLAA